MVWDPWGMLFRIQDLLHAHTPLPSFPGSNTPSPWIPKCVPLGPETPSPRVQNTITLDPNQCYLRTLNTIPLCPKHLFPGSQTLSPRTLNNILRDQKHHPPLQMVMVFGILGGCCLGPLEDAIWDPGGWCLGYT